VVINVLEVEDVLAGLVPARLDLLTQLERFVGDSVEFPEGHVEGVLELGHEGFNCLLVVGLI